MNSSKAEKLFILMKQYGVEHFKTLELEIKMSAVAKKVKKQKDDRVIIKNPPIQAAPPVDMKIPHHVNEVAKLMKLNDNDLVDKLFPDYSQMIPKQGSE